MSNVLVVGGAGYVGTVLCEELADRGYGVRVFDRMYFGEEALRGIWDRVEVFQGDMRSVGRDVLEGVDAVINLGGLSNDPMAEYNPEATYQINTVAATKLADTCKALGIRRYIFASSCSVYDKGVKDDDGNLLQSEESEVSPGATYPRSKRDSELHLLAIADEDFCPVMLRKGTIYGFSPRMRYDLVMNTFVKDALTKGVLTLHYGGELWRPLVDVRDVAHAYISCLEAPEEKVRGEIFNVVFHNFRISELALRVREALRTFGIQTEIQPDYDYTNVRNYRVSGDKMERVLGFMPRRTIEESVADMVDKIRSHGYTDFDNPRYYNMRWMDLREAAARISSDGSIFHALASTKRLGGPA